MKANRKFIKADDEAVSPVIAVILMVAITVVLAATVYVWVSGFGAQGTQPAKSISLTSGGSIDQVDIWNTDADPDAAGTDIDGDDDFYRKTYVVSSATAGMKYSDLTLTVNGATLTFEETNCNPTADDPATTDGNKWSACASAARASSAVVTAGDRIVIQHASSLAGTTLRVLDANANSVILTLVVG